MPIDPAVVGEPSPQSMVAVKSAGVAALLLSSKVATASLKTDCSPTAKLTGKAVMTVATVRPAAARNRNPATSAGTTRDRLRMDEPLLDVRLPSHVENGRYGSTSRTVGGARKAGD